MVGVSWAVKAITGFSLFLAFFQACATTTGQEEATPSIDLHYLRSGAVTNVDTCLRVTGDEDATRLWNRLNKGSSEQEPTPAEIVSEYVNENTERGVATLYLCALIAKAWSSPTRLPRKHEAEQAYAALVQSPGRTDEPPASLSGVSDTHHALVVNFPPSRHDQPEFDSLCSDTSGSTQTAQGESEPAANKASAIGGVPLVLPAQSVSRLLAVPRLLPASYFGGLVISNVDIEGPLVLDYASVNVPVAFVRVHIRPNVLSRDIYKRSPRSAIAVRISGAHIAKRMSFFYSTFGGRFEVQRSRFDEALHFHQVTQTPIADNRKNSDDCGDLKPGKVWISRTEFAYGLILQESKFGSLGFNTNDLGSMSVVDVDFHSAEIEDNKMRSIYLKRVYSMGEFVVRQNRIDGSITVVENWCGNSKTGLNCRARVSNGFPDREITDNILSGGLLYAVGDSTDLRLGNNVVNSGSVLCLPPPEQSSKKWQGSIDLIGARFDGMLKISEWKFAKDNEYQKTKNSAEDCWTEHDQSAANRIDVNVSKRIWGNSYCPALGREETPQEVSRIYLDDAVVHNLIWDLPIDCEKFRWSGTGLVYDIWGDLQKNYQLLPSDNSGADADQTNTIDRNSSREPKGLTANVWDVLQRWRYAMMQYDPDAISDMATYLSEHGKFLDSRYLLVEAKRLNYMPDCSPDSNFFSCIVSAIGGISGGASSTGSFDGQTSEGFLGRTYQRFIHWVRTTGAFVFLAPGGYGGLPGRAVMMLLGGLGFFWLCYRAYSAIRESRYQKARQNLDEVIKAFEESDLLEDQDYGASLKKSLEFFDMHRVDPQMDKPEGYKLIESIEKELKELVGNKGSGRAAVAVLVDRINFDHLRVSYVGDSKIYGFSQFDIASKPRRITLLRYSLDCIIPVINLHAYSNYYPEWGFIRFLSVCQHILGWWLLTVFLASVAIL